MVRIFPSHSFTHFCLYHSECEGMEMFWPDQWCSIETLSKKTSQLLYHAELFKLVQQPRSYDNSYWWGGGGGWHVFEDSWSHCVPQQRKRVVAKFNPHHPTLHHHSKHTILKISSPQPPQRLTALLSTSLHPSAGLKKTLKPTGPTAKGIEK